jgi:hypothetical protein
VSRITGKFKIPDCGIDLLLGVEAEDVEVCKREGRRPLSALTFGRSDGATRGPRSSLAGLLSLSGLVN